MAVDLLYVAFNRLEFTRATFEALIHNTNWAEVRKLYVHDDGSTDGTAVYLRACLSEIGFVDHEFQCARLGGPVAAMNWVLDRHAEEEPGTEVFAKVDNDMVVCPGWLDEMLRVMEKYPELDILGMEPFVGDPTPPPLLDARTFSGGAGQEAETFAEHIGGKGLIRIRSFRNCRMVARGYMGFTGWQTSHPEVRKGWITPDLPVFGLDQVPIPRWQALTEDYVEAGWQRRWPTYSEDSYDYWNWYMDRDGVLKERG